MTWDEVDYYLYGVQGVASSNLAVPTNIFKIASFKLAICFIADNTLLKLLWYWLSLFLGLIPSFSHTYFLYHTTDGR
jgi:hypothetical protein